MIVEKWKKKQDLIVLVIVFILFILLWQTFLLYPIKIFVVGLHELSHGLAAILMGGRINHIEINSRIGGYCQYSLPVEAGFFRQSVVASAGYLGSILLGALIFIFASRTRWDRTITFLVAVVLFVLSILSIKGGGWFGIIFCFGFATLLVIAVKWLPDKFHDLFLKCLGITSCLYVIIDIKEDLIDRSGIGNDADKIAEMLKAPFLSVPIGIFWIVLALVVLFYTYKISIKAD